VYTESVCRCRCVYTNDSFNDRTRNRNSREQDHGWYRRAGYQQHPLSGPCHRNSSRRDGDYHRDCHLLRGAFQSAYISGDRHSQCNNCSNSGRSGTSSSGIGPPRQIQPSVDDRRRKQTRSHRQPSLRPPESSLRSTLWQSECGDFPFVFGWWITNTQLRLPPFSIYPSAFQSILTRKKTEFHKRRIAYLHTKLNTGKIIKHGITRNRTHGLHVSAVSCYSSASFINLLWVLCCFRCVISF